MRLANNFRRLRPPSTRSSAARDSLPLGIDVGSDQIAIVHAVRHGDEIRIMRAGRANYSGEPSATIVALLDELQIAERRCVLSAPPNEMAIVPWTVPNAFPRHHLDNAAAFKVEDNQVGETGGRVVRHDVVKVSPDAPVGETRFVVTARSAHVRELEALAAAADLELVAVDSPALAWLRVNAGGVVDDRARTPFVTLLAADGPLLNVLPVSDEAFPSALKSIVSTANAARPLEITSLGWMGDIESKRYAAAQTRLREIGITISPLEINDSLVPYWAFAYALASWSWN